MKRLTAILIVLCLMSFTIYSANGMSDTPGGVPTGVPTGITIAVNNKRLELINAPQKINNRIIGPMREIMQQLNATFAWAQNLRQLSIYGESRYVILTIGSNIMRVGVYKSDETGKLSYEAEQELALDAAPQIINDYVYAPVRPVAEALGATVRWDESSQIQYIYTARFSNQTSDSVHGSAQTVSGGVVFQEISAAAAQRWYESNSAFMMIYYSGLKESNRVVLDYAKKAAGGFGLRLYGVDVDSPNFNNTTGRLTFIWDYMERDGTNNLPALFFVTGHKNVTPLVRPRDYQSVDFCMTAWYYLLLGQTSGLPVISAPAGLWNEISRAQAIIKYANNEKFLYICYNSIDPTSNALMPLLKLAATKAKAQVFATDCARLIESDYWFGVDALNGKALSQYPTIFFVFGRSRIPYASVQPGNINEVLSAFANFKD